MENEEARRELLGGISIDADAQAQKLITDAEKSASERINAAKRQAERLAEEAAEKAQTQVREIEHEAATRLSASKRRMLLEMKEKIYQDVIKQCTAELEDLIGSERYGNILEDWIVQAASGLRTEAASVNCSDAERGMVSEVLDRAAARVEEYAGQPVKLTLSEERPLLGQGIVVTSADGRTAFNNQISSRLFRLQTKIRKLVHDRLFQDM